MLCLPDIIRDYEPSVQPLVRTVEAAATLTALLIAVWPFARALAIQIDV